MEKYQNFIDGKFIPSTNKDDVKVINPATGHGICSVPESSNSDVEAAISAAEAAQPHWAKLPAIERAKKLHNLADKIRRNLETIARVITEEQGKILGLSRIEVGFTADYVDYM